MIKFLTFGGVLGGAALVIAAIGGVRAYMGDDVAFHVTFGLGVTVVLIFLHSLLLAQTRAWFAPFDDIKKNGVELIPEVLGFLPNRRRAVQGPIIVVALAVIAPIVALTDLQGITPRWVHGAIEVAVIAGHGVVFVYGIDALKRLRMVLESIEQELRKAQ